MVKNAAMIGSITGGFAGFVGGLLFAVVKCQFDKSSGRKYIGKANQAEKDWDVAALCSTIGCVVGAATGGLIGLNY
jgi:hypothetical protein